MTIAVGCTGGKHRSVAMAPELAVTGRGGRDDRTAWSAGLRRKGTTTIDVVTREVTPDALPPSDVFAGVGRFELGLRDGSDVAVYPRRPAKGGGS